MADFEPLGEHEAKQYAGLERAYATAFDIKPVVARTSRFEPLTVPLVIEPRAVYLNAGNPIIRLLAARPDLADEVSRVALRAIYNNAMIRQSGQPRPDVAEAMCTDYNRVIELMLEFAGRPGGPRPARPRPAYLSCAVTLPEGEPRSEEIFAAVRAVLEDGPYYWQVRRADSPPDGSELPMGLDEPPAGAALNVAVFAGPTLNQGVLNEASIGQILGLPQLVLIDEGQPELPPSFVDVPRSTVRGGEAALLEQVLTALAGHPEVRRVRTYERYVSPSILTRVAGLQDEAAGSAISARYPTWPEFLAADTEEVARLAGTDAASVEAAKTVLRLLDEED
jgi:hypothetical protein